MLTGEGEGVVHADLSRWGGEGRKGWRRRRGRRTTRCSGSGGGRHGEPGRRLKEGVPRGLCRGLDLVGKAVLEAAARAVEAEPKRGKGVAERQTRLQLSGLGSVRRGGKRGLLSDAVRRFRVTVVTLDVEEVASGAEGANPEGAEGTAGDVPAAPMRVALLGRVVDKQAAAAIVTVASCVVAPT